MSNDAEYTAIVPFPGYILATPLEASSQGSITVAGDEQQQEMAAKVLAVGEDLTETINGNQIVTSTSVKVGDRIVHRNWGSQVFSYNGEKYKFIKFTDVVGRINK